MRKDAIYILKTILKQLLKLLDSFVKHSFNVSFYLFIFIRASNEITVTKTGEQTIFIPKHKRIRVSSNDFIGLHYAQSTDNGVLSLSRTVGGIVTDKQLSRWVNNSETFITNVKPTLKAKILLRNHYCLWLVWWSLTILIYLKFIICII